MSEVLYDAQCFDATLHIRLPKEILPRVHHFARGKGLSASSWLRMIVYQALQTDGMSDDEFHIGAGTLDNSNPRVGRPPLYPFRVMQIGDSFFAPGKTPHGMQNCAIAHRPRKFRCRTIELGGVKGTRVWRIA